MIRMEDLLGAVVEMEILAKEASLIIVEHDAHRTYTSFADNRIRVDEIGEEIIVEIYIPLKANKGIRVHYHIPFSRVDDPHYIQGSQGI